MSNFNFPEDLLLDVLSRLPLKTIVRFSLVSKSWRNWIHSRSFTKMYLNRQESCASNSTIVFGCRDDKFTKLVYFDCNKYSVTEKLDYPLLKGRKKTSAAALVGSCNGLLCLHYTYRKIVLWNPLSQQCKVISRPIFSSKRIRVECAYGFGYEKASDDYKVVALMSSSRYTEHKFEHIYEGWTYSLKLKRWKRVENFSYHLGSSKNGVLVSGALHWITFEDDLLLGFNLADEKFCSLPKPNHSRDISSLNVGNLGGFLSVICKSSKNFCFEMWVMKDYGVKDSWILISNLKLSHQAGQGYWQLRPIAYGKSNKQVIFEDLFASVLFVYDLEKQSFLGKFVDNGFLGLKACTYFETLEWFECYETVGKSSMHKRTRKRATDEANTLTDRTKHRKRIKL